MRNLLLLLLSMLIMHTSFGQIHIEGFALQACGSLKALRPYDIDDPYDIDNPSVRFDRLQELKTTHQPIYIEALVPPLHPEERIMVYQPLRESTCRKCKKFSALVYGLENTVNCYIINPNFRRNVYITFSSPKDQRVQLKTFQMNPDSEEGRTWFRIVLVDSLMTPGHVIKFLVYQVPGTGS